MHNTNYGDCHLQAVIKKWFREKEYGFIDNGSGPDIMVRKADLVNCQYLKIGASVEFECHIDKQGLVAKKVKLTKSLNNNPKTNKTRTAKPHYFGVMK